MMFYMDPVNGSIKFMRSRTKPEEGHWECSYLIKLIEVGRPLLTSGGTVV